MHRKIKNTTSAHILMFIMLLCAGMFFSLSCEETTGPQGSGVTSNYHVLLTAEESTITTNGGTTLLVAKVYSGADTANVVSGIGVEFSASLGDTLFPVVVENNVTDADGIARARVFGTTKTGMVAITALVQVSTREQISAMDFVTITASTGGNPEDIPSDAAFIQADYSEAYVVADNGAYSVSVTALVSDSKRNQVKDGTVVLFSLSGAGELGVLIPGQVATKDGVAATSMLYSQTDAGKQVTLIATSGDAADTLKVLLPGFKPSYFVIDAQPKSIPADGKSESIIKITLFDKSGSSANVPDGTLVTITDTTGLLKSTLLKTVGGVATTTLRASTTPGKFTLTVQSGDYTDSAEVMFEELGAIVNNVSTIDLSTDNSELRADENRSTTIRATLKRFDGTIIKMPTTVLFETDLGQITQRAVSDTVTGTAIALFTSNKVGTAHIKASVGNVFDTIDIFMIPGPPLSITLTFDPASVGIQGSGRNASLLINALVLDERNNPVKDSTLVKFEMVGSADPDASLSSPIPGNSHITQPIPTTNGNASVSFTSGKIAGAIRVRATVVYVSNNPILPPVTSETTEILVYSGSPYIDMNDVNDPFTESRITLSGGPLNIYGGELNTDVSKSSIGIMISDEYKNPVPRGTSIWMTTTGGMITTSTGYTEIAPPAINAATEGEKYVNSYEGITYVTLYAGNPSPTLVNSRILENPNFSTHGGPSTFDIPARLLARGYGDFDFDGDYNDGISIVSAYTLGLDQNGNQTVVWNFIPIVFSYAINTFTAVAQSTTLNLGQTTGIDITVMDMNGNPVVAGSTLTFTTEFGKVSPGQIVTSDPGTTRYRVSLTNNLDPLTDNATDTVVNVKIESPNGNVVTASNPVHLTLTP